MDAIFSLDTLWYLMLIFYVPACAGLILIVLLQKGKGVGFSGAFGMGGGGDAIFGPRSSRSLPQKITYSMAAIFMVLALCMSVISGRVNRGPAPELKADDTAAAVSSEELDTLLDPTAPVPADGATTPAADAAADGGTTIQVGTDPSATTTATPTETPDPLAPVPIPQEETTGIGVLSPNVVVEPADAPMPAEAAAPAETVAPADTAPADAPAPAETAAPAETVAPADAAPATDAETVQ